MRLAVALVALLGGCTRSSGQEPASVEEAPASTTKREAGASPPVTRRSMTSKTTQDGVTLSFAMTRGAEAISVDYRIENNSDERIYVCDKLLVLMQKTQKWRAFPAVSLQNMEGKPDTARIVVGTPPTDVNSMVVPPVTFKAIEPGASLSESRSLPLPLKSYNAMGMTAPLSKKIDKAVLVVQAFRGEPPYWRELEGESGTIKIPDGFTPKDLVSDPVAIP